MPLEQSTDTSLVICETQDAPGTNIHAGEETTSQRLKLLSSETMSQPALKPDSKDPGKSIKLFTWKDELDPSSCSAEEEAANVVAESKAYQEVIAHETHESQSKKKQKLTHTVPYVLTPEHEEYRRLLDAHEKWDKELTTIHGLSKAEAGLVSDIVVKYGQSQDFPEKDPDEEYSRHLMQLARPGWEQFRSIMSCFQEHVLPTGWHHKKDEETGEWTVVKMGAH